MTISSRPLTRFMPPDTGHGSSATGSALPDALRVEWNIDRETLVADTYTSLVWRVRRQTGTAIVKSLKPAGMDELPGMAYLDWRTGLGAIRVLAREGTTFLLEDAGHQTLGDLVRAGGDMAATGIIAELLHDLHRASDRPPPDELVSLEQNYRSLFQYSDTGEVPAIRNLLAWARDESRNLLAWQESVRPLHGDLHHDNIVDDGTGRWRAIDPKGLIGDAAYEVANVFGNPVGAPGLVVDPERIKYLAHRLSRILNMSEQKILRYAATHAALSICWSREGPQTPAALENISERLAFAEIARQLIR